MLSKQEIRNKLLSDDRWLVRGMLAIYRRQTSQEQSYAQTIEHNGEGFNATDAEILSSFSEQVLRGRTLSPKQLEIARRCMPKYAGQLLRIAEREQAVRPNVLHGVQVDEAGLDSFGTSPKEYMPQQLEMELAGSIF